MPDYAAHYIFGEALLADERIHALIADQTAWRWGLQGPDPLFFRRDTDRAGGAMHRGAPEGMVEEMLLCLKTLTRSARDTAGSWLFGFLGHYFLDRTVHPYVHARMEEMSRRMPNATGNACHYQIETDMDLDLYLCVHRKPLSDFDPGRGMSLLPRQKEVIAGILSAGASAKGAVIPVQATEKALDSFSTAQRLIFRGGPPLRAAARGLELLLGKSRQFTGHIKGKRPRWDSLNLSRAAWVDPRDGAVRAQSVPDLLEQAKKEALPALERLSLLMEQKGRGGLDLGGLDFSGRQ